MLIEIILAQFICLFPIFLVAYLILFYHTNSLMKKRNEIRNRLMGEYLRINRPNQIPQDFIPIRYADNEKFNKYLKFLPWSGAGWIGKHRKEIIFLSEHNSSIIEERYPLFDSDIQWIGRDFLKNGGVSWFIIQHNGKQTYFTSETGTFIFGSMAQTFEIFESVKD